MAAKKAVSKKAEKPAYQKMDPKIKRRWVEALRSGQYKQGRGCLLEIGVDTPNQPTYCCLGVLSDLYHKEKGSALKVGGAFLGPTVRKWAGLNCGNPIIDSDNMSASGCNDVFVYSFKRIATLIEKNL